MTMALSAVGDRWQELSKDYPCPIHTLSNRGGTRLRSDRNDRNIGSCTEPSSLAPKICQHKYYSDVGGAGATTYVCFYLLSSSGRLKSLS